MAFLLFLYSRTSIRAAKLNAQRHREADGGQIDWRNHNRRLHGQEEPVRESTLREVFVQQVKGVEGPISGGGQGSAAIKTGSLTAEANEGGEEAARERKLEHAKARRRLGADKDS